MVTQLNERPTTDLFLKKYMALANEFVQAQQLRQTIGRSDADAQFKALTQPAVATGWTNPKLNPLRDFSTRQRSLGMPGSPLSGQELIRAAYTQILGTNLLLDSFRNRVLESKLLNGDLSIREFVRALAKSEYYRETFYLSCSNNRFVELSFKHLLGRPPYTQRETFDYSSIASRKGFEATINALVDSPEYQEIFGEDTLPYARKMHEDASGQGFSRTGITDLGLLGALTKTIGNPTTSSYVQALFTEQPRPMQVLSPPVQPPKASPTQAEVLGKYMQMGRDATSSFVYLSWSKGTEALRPLRPFSIRQRALGTTGSPSLSGQELVRAAYLQVFGTDLFLDTFRNKVLESKLLNSELSIREFVRALAKTDYYRETFYLSCSNNRFVELSFKHLLGRAPFSQREMFDYSSIASRKGFAATIDALVDGVEYQETFGESTLPYMRKMHEGPNVQGFDSVGITDPGLLTALDLIGNPTTSSYVQAKAKSFTLCNYQFLAPKS